MDTNENNIEFLTNEDTATVFFTQVRYISKIKKLAESHPDECVIVNENKDGSIIAHVPTKWVKVSPPRQLTDEQIEAARERMTSMVSRTSLLTD